MTLLGFDLPVILQFNDSHESDGFEEAIWATVAGAEGIKGGMRVFAELCEINEVCANVSSRLEYRRNHTGYKCLISSSECA